MFKKSIILLFALATFAGSISAQIRPGIKAGYNVGGVRAEFLGPPHPDKPNAASQPENFNMRSGFQIGMIADMPINDTWAIQPGARFAMHGFSDKYNDGGATGAKEERKFSFFYLQVPVYVQYRMNIAEEANLLFQAGPYAGFGLFGQQARTRRGATAGLTDDQKKISFGSDPTKSSDDLQRLDYGIGAGVGIEFFRFQFMVNYDFGLNKAHFRKLSAPGTYDVNLSNHSISVTLAVIFGRRDPLQNMRDF